MRAPFQILAIPYRFSHGELQFCVLHRADKDMWQFVAGGGEDYETPPAAAKREILEETGASSGDIIELKSSCCVPTSIFSEEHTKNWNPGTYVIPEYSFAFMCDMDINLSEEHSEYIWLPYDQACKTLKWDSNRTALYELKRRLEESL